MKIEVFSRMGLFGRRTYFRVRADNGKIIAQSEGYSRRIDAIGTIQSLRTDLPRAEIVDA